MTLLIQVSRRPGDLCVDLRPSRVISALMSALKALRYEVKIVVEPEWGQS